MDFIRQIVESGSLEYTLPDCANPIRICRYWFVDFMDYTISCPKCETLVSVKDEYMFCNECNILDSSLHDKLLKDLKAWKFIVDGGEQIGKYNNMYVPVHFEYDDEDNEDIYGVIEFQFIEFDKWSESPRDEYMIHLTVFTSEEKKHEWFIEKVK